jgi:hypothetical protein
MENKDQEFLDLTEMNELDQEPLEQAIEKIDLVTFDTTHFKTILQETSL